ncbi:hypothetical protein ABBQ32_007029 [Trebouxia sp. C0010 RCD-2024]
MSLLAQSRHSPYFAKARRALQDADLDTGLCPIGTYHPAAMAGAGLRHPACFAAFRWLAAVFKGNSSSCETSLLSASKLPIGDTESNILELAVSHGQPISCQLSAKHTCKGAGGRPVPQTQDGVVVTKKGPDSWLVTAKCFTPGAGSFDVELKILWDIYTLEGVQSSQCNHFRVVDCSNEAGFQQWCKEAGGAAAALMTDHSSRPWTAFKPQECHQKIHSTALRIKAQQGYPRYKPQQRLFRFIRLHTISCQLAHAIKGLRVQVSSVATTVSQHAVRIGQVYEQVQEHNDDLVQLHFQNAQPSSGSLGGPSNAAHNSASCANNSASCATESSSKLKGLGNLENPFESSTLLWNEEFTEFLNDPSFPCDSSLWPNVSDVSSYDVSTPPVPIPTAANTEPHPGAAQPAEAACPAFDANLKNEQIQPFVLQALQTIKPRSCSALDLSKLLWPEETAMRSCMKRMISGVLYSRTVTPMVMKNGTHWSHV